MSNRDITGVYCQCFFRSKSKGLEEDDRCWGVAMSSNWIHCHSKLEMFVAVSYRSCSFFLPLFADLSSNVGSASSLQDSGMEKGKNCMGKACIFIPRDTAGASPHSASLS